MTEEKPKTEEKKEEVVSKTNEPTKDNKVSDDKKTQVKDNKKEEKKPEPKKKYEAVARGQSLRASKKHCMYICSFIKKKNIDTAITDLQSVINMKIAIPFKGEIPHRKGKGMMSGRYPIKTAKQFIPLLQGLKGNATVNGLDLEKVVITEASASWASRPLRKGSVEAKRTHVILKAKEMQMKTKKEKIK